MSLENQSDRTSGFISAPGFEIVKTNCIGRHFAKLIVQSKQDKEGWKGTIRWMQREQGLWQFDEKTEQIILDYLSTNYSPESPTSPKRAPLEIE